MIPSRIFAALLFIAGTATSASYIPTNSNSNSITTQQQRRQSSPIPPTNAPDLTTTFTNAASSACRLALASMPRPPASESGIALCINIPFLDNSTGIYRASFQLYKVAEPRGSWANVSLSDIVPSVVWPSSSMSPMQAPRPSSARAEEAERENVRDGPELVQTYEWVGRLNAAVLAKAMNLTTLQTALLPLVSLSSASNPDLNATRLSTEEASFLVGTLSQQPRTKKPFVLPGTKIEIFPIGAIITGSWAVLLVGFVGWGTVGKVGFREHYRRRIARDRAAVEKRGRI